jgi:hypothetical protein
VAHAKNVGGADVYSLSLAAGRSERRRSLFIAGIAISEATAVAIPVRTQPGRKISATLRSLAKKAKIDRPETLSYSLSEPASSRSLAAVHTLRVPPPSHERIHLVMGPGRSDRAPTPQVVAIVAKEENGRIVNYRTGYSR